MRTFAAVSVAAVTAAVAAAPAAAKEITSVKVCGPDACASAAGTGVRQAFRGPQEERFAPYPPAVSEYYRVELGYGARGRTLHEVSSWFVAKAGSVRPADGSARWSVVPALQLAGLRQLAANVKPFPRPELRKVMIGDRVAAEPQAYVELFAARRTYPRKDPGPPVPLEFTWAAENPWSGTYTLYYLPASRTIYGFAVGREITYAAVPDDLATRIDRERRGLPPTEPADGFRWVPFTAAAAAALAALLGLIYVVGRRRRRGPAQQPAPA